MKSVPGRAVLTTLASITLASALGAPLVAAPPVLAASSGGGEVARGRYLVGIMGCSDCHTPMKMGPNGPEPDRSRFLSGHPQGMKLGAPPKGGAGWAWSGAATNTAFHGPWGTTYAINLTSDRETGLGGWTEENFVKALKSGKHLGVGRPILPPMPWPSTAQATEDDLRAVFAYLRTVPPIRNLAPEYQPPAPSPAQAASQSPSR